LFTWRWWEGGGGRALVAKWASDGKVSEKDTPAPTAAEHSLPVRFAEQGTSYATRCDALRFGDAPRRGFFFLFFRSFSLSFPFFFVAAAETKGGGSGLITHQRPLRAQEASARERLLGRSTAGRTTPASRRSGVPDRACLGPRKGGGQNRSTMRTDPPGRRTTDNVDGRPGYLHITTIAVAIVSVISSSIAIRRRRTTTGRKGRHAPPGRARAVAIAKKRRHCTPSGGQYGRNAAPRTRQHTCRTGGCWHGGAQTNVVVRDRAQCGPRSPSVDGASQPLLESYPPLSRASPDGQTRFNSRNPRFHAATGCLPSQFDSLRSRPVQSLSLYLFFLFP